MKFKSVLRSYLIQEKYLLIFCLLFCVSSCSSQKNEDKSTKHKSPYSEKFHEKSNNAKLYIACIVLNDLKNYDSSKLLSENDVFLNIAGKVQSRNYLVPNIDSLVDHYKRVNNVDFYSDSIIHSLTSFIECYDLINFMFLGIDDDDDIQMKLFDNKIKNDQELKKIYLLYMKDRPDLSSLSSGEGIALSIQLSYYLYLQDDKKRKNIIKAML